jgi:hypothetical protein
MQSVSGHRTKNPLVLLFVSIAGALLNMLIQYFSRGRLGIPLFLDTVLTMTVTFYGWLPYLFVLCNIAVALVTVVFIRWFSQEMSINYTEKPFSQSHGKSLWQSQWLQDLIGRAIVLVLLSFALCLVISVLGAFLR